MHRLVQFHAIHRPNIAGSAAVAPPEPGNLPSDLLKYTCSALAEHTATPDRCWFCLWNGYGWLHSNGRSHIEWSRAGEATKPSSPAPPAPLVPAAWQNAACVHLPYRDYLLFEGPLEAATELGWNMPGGGFVPQSPNLFWPDDHAWCVASEIDLFCTLVAGSDALAASLLADPRLEAWPVFPGDSVTADSDEINV
jgi:hypothetical protein